MIILGSYSLAFFYKGNNFCDFLFASLGMIALPKLDILLQGCHSQGKISGKRNFFQIREKSGIFMDGQGNLERTWKVREKSGNLKINGYARQTLENLCIL